MGRARSRRRRGKTGGQGSGGSGKGKGTGGSRGRSSSNRGGQGSGGSGKGKSTGGSKGRSNANRNTKNNNNKVKVNKAKEAEKQVRVDRRDDRLKKQFGLDYNDMNDSFRIKINPSQWLGGFTEKTGIPTGFISNNLPGFVKNMKIDHQLKSPNKVAVHPSNSKWGGGVAEDLLLTTQANQAQKAQQKAEEKALDTQYKQDQAIYNNNNKTTTDNLMSFDTSTDQEKLNHLYKQNFGRDASFGTLGGADYWIDTHKPQTREDWKEINRMLAGSQEADSYRTTQKVRPGAVNPALSMAENAAKGNVYANHFNPGGVLAATKKDGTLNDLSNTIFAGKGAGEEGNMGTSDGAAVLNNIAKDIKFEVPNIGGEYFNQGVNAQLFDNNQRPIDNHEIAQTTGSEGTTLSSGVLDDKAAAAAAAATGGTGAGTGSGTGTGTGTGNTAARPGIDLSGNSGSTGNWYDGYGSGEEWLKANPQDGGKSDNGMGDFMKFMMLMSVMGGGRGGGGYGGSQFGYGGLTPGGVQPAYDPMKQLQGMGTWFKDNFGSGSASTGNLNTP